MSKLKQKGASKVFGLGCNRQMKLGVLPKGYFSLALSLKSLKSLDWQKVPQSSQRMGEGGVGTDILNVTSIASSACFKKSFLIVVVCFGIFRLNI